MSKRIIYTKPDGCLAVVTPIADVNIVLEKDIPVDAVNPRVIDDAEYVKLDQTLFPAFEDDGTKVVINLDKVRALIRDKRNRSLKKLDEKAYAAERDPNGNLTEINNEAQRLRDIPEDSRFLSTDLSILKDLLIEAEIQV